MRFSTDDGRFGFVVTPLTGTGMYRFQIIIGGELVGDEEPCFLESAMGSLGELSLLDDDRLGRVSADPAAALAAIDSDDLLNEAALLQVAESLDGWTVRGYVYEGNATLLARAYPPGSDVAAGPILVSVVPSADYHAIFEAARGFWAETRHGHRR